jgi:hypothetical protein
MESPGSRGSAACMFGDVLYGSSRGSALYALKRQSRTSARRIQGILPLQIDDAMTFTASPGHGNQRVIQQSWSPSSGEGMLPSRGVVEHCTIGRLSAKQETSGRSYSRGHRLMVCRFASSLFRTYAKFKCGRGVIRLSSPRAESCEDQSAPTYKTPRGWRTISPCPHSTPRSPLFPA